MIAKTFEVGDLVWAKMKSYPPWPGKVNEPPNEKGKKGQQYVYFFGTQNHSWIKDENIMHHSDEQLKNICKKKFQGYFEAIEEIKKESLTKVKSPAKLPNDDNKKDLATDKPAKVPKVKNKLTKENVLKPDHTSNKISKKRKLSTEENLLKTDPVSPNKISKKRKSSTEENAAGSDHTSLNKISKKTKLSTGEDVLKSDHISSNKVSKNHKLSNEEQNISDPEPKKPQDFSDLIKNVLECLTLDEEEEAKKRKLEEQGKIENVEVGDKEKNGMIEIVEEETPENIPLALPGETLPGETLPGETLPGETLPGETLPGETLPEETLPEETLPEETLPEETLPEEASPMVMLPVETPPMDTLLLGDPKKETLLGFLGLGNIGKRFAINLMRAGYKVMVWNRTIGKCDDLVKQGAKMGYTVAEVVKSCETTFCCVSDADAVRTIVLSDGGVLTGFEGLEPGSRRFVEMSSIDTVTLKDMSEEIFNAGMHYFEASVMGNKEGADEGKMLILGGGDKDLFNVCMPYFIAMAGSAFYLSGELGHCAGVTALSNTFMGVMYAAMAEILALAKRAGLAAGDLLEIFELRGILSPLLQDKGKAIMEKNYVKDTPIHIQEKDMTMAIQMSDQVDQPTPIASIGTSIYSRAKMMAMSKYDCTGTYLCYHH